ncbi:MAG TPA: hypothetical protein VGV12_11585 [Gemmatimonadales bacterium]|nr:hypothetical protein [Gemmatimonadales bacterium]
MRTLGRLLTTIVLGALAAPPSGLHAQAPTELADMCKAVGEAQVGQWASFDATASTGGGKLRLAVVGSERSGDSTFYWFEVNAAGKDPSRSGIVQILAPNLASGATSPRALIVKWGGQPAVKVSGQMAGMMAQKEGQGSSAFDWAAQCTSAHVVGWESVTVPAGTFRALHVTANDGTEVWGSREVPLGMVKLRSKKGDLTLSARGTDAKSSITEKPLEMPGMMMPPSKP